jgi:hypothetical protein
MNKKHQAFWEELKALEQKHGLKLQIVEPAVPPARVQLAPIRIPKVTRAQRKQLEAILGIEPWYKRLFKKSHEGRTTTEIQDS